ncbi:hypothetical protein Dda_6350 [Drechslerella dactyloides]|uniref:Uncharacterized protein n=1 Tax=Drechslerella dactyloides TaxID=74499 RepID=A0AAD6NHB9_DREDA|nr:hypothetical protein Dda_6350 [Drechslerella dactyloides]
MGKTQTESMPESNCIQPLSTEDAATLEVGNDPLVAPTAAESREQLLYMPLSSAVNRALGIVEILEQILIYVAATDWDQFGIEGARKRSAAEIDPMITILMRCGLVNRFWRDVIIRSKRISHQLWRVANNTIDIGSADDPNAVNTDLELVLSPRFVRGTGERMNYPFLAFFTSRLSLAFGYDQSFEFAAWPDAHYKLFQKANFPTSFFTWPPNPYVYMCLQFSHHISPAFQRIGGIDWWAYRAEPMSAQSSCRPFRESNGCCLMLIENKNGVTCRDIWKQFCKFMDTQRSRPGTRYHLTNIWIGIGKEFEYPLDADNSQINILRLTNSGIISFAGGGLTGTEPESNPTEPYDYIVKAESFQRIECQSDVTQQSKAPNDKLHALKAAATSIPHDLAYRLLNPVQQ